MTNSNNVSVQLKNIIISLIIFISFRLEIEQPINLNLLEIVLIILVLFIIFRNKKIVILNNSFAQFLVIFLILISVILFQSLIRANVYNFINLFKYLEILFLIYLVHYLIQNSTFLYKFLNWFFITPSIISLFLSIFYLINGVNSKILVEIPIILVSYFLIVKNRKILYIFFNIISFIFILLIRSRTNLILLIIINLILISFSKYRSQRKNISNLLKKFILLFAFISLLYLNFERIISFLQIGVSTVSNIERTNMLVFALRNIQNNLFFGSGPGVTPYLFSVSEYTIRFKVDNLTIHNLYLEVLLEVGLIGFLPFIVMIIHILKTQILNMKRTNGILYKYNVLLFIILITLLFNLALIPLSGSLRLYFALIVGSIYGSATVSMNTNFEKEKQSWKKY